MEINGTLLMVMISFVIFMMLMRAWFFEPIRQIKADREAKMTQDQQDAVGFSEQLSDLQQRYEQDLRDAQKKAQQVIQEIRQQAKQSAAGTLAEAREKTGRELESQMTALAAWREETYQKLSDERQSLAETIVRKVTADRMAAASKS